MTSKIHLEKNITLNFDDSGGTARDLTGDMVPGSLSINGIMFEQIDMTAISDAVHKFVAGQGDLTIGAQFYMNNTATTGAFTVLNPMNGKEGTLTLAFGQAGAAPTNGDPELESEFTLFIQGFPISGGRVLIDAQWKPGPNASTTAAGFWTTVGA